MWRRRTWPPEKPSGIIGITPTATQAQNDQAAKTQPPHQGRLCRPPEVKIQCSWVSVPLISRMYMPGNETLRPLPQRGDGYHPRVNNTKTDLKPDRRARPSRCQHQRYFDRCFKDMTVCCCGPSINPNKDETRQTPNEQCLSPTCTPKLKALIVYI